MDLHGGWIKYLENSSVVYSGENVVVFMIIYSQALRVLIGVLPSFDCLVGKIWHQQLGTSPILLSIGWENSVNCFPHP